MDKVDLKAERRDLYAPPRSKFVEVSVPPMRFLAVEGSGDPNTSPSYAAAVQALYAASYAAKFASKSSYERDYVVLPLEGVWWADDMRTFLTREKDAWSWRMLIRQPDWLSDADLTAAIEAAHRKGADVERRLRIEAFEEGRCVQILHIGSYDDEGPTLRRLHEEVLPERGLRPTGPHHEIYLGDPRRTAPEKLRTVLRQPVAEL